MNATVSARDTPWRVNHIPRRKDRTTLAIHVFTSLFLLLLLFSLVSLPPLTHSLLSLFSHVSLLSLYSLALFSHFTFSPHCSNSLLSLSLSLSLYTHSLHFCHTLYSPLLCTLLPLLCLSHSILFHALLSHRFSLSTRTHTPRMHVRCQSRTGTSRRSVRRAVFECDCSRGVLFLDWRESVAPKRSSDSRASLHRNCTQRCSGLDS
jgi:hypothetical protein